ncbi:MAG: pyruvate kinase [Ignavibacteria bacterium]
MIFKKTKIICTLGPATSKVTTITKLVKAGMDFARLNFSHGSYQEHYNLIQNLRKVESLTRTHIPIIQDLSGPKIRTGKFVNGKIELKQDAIVSLQHSNQIGNERLIPININLLKTSVQPDFKILLDDGKLTLQIESINHRKKIILARVIKGGILSDHKGVNIPDCKIPLPSLTKKDIADLKFGLMNNVNLIALSFVRQPEDVIHIKKLIKSYNKEIPVIAKIEKPEALHHIDEIIKVSDAIMIARGDLGIEISPENVPSVQKQLIAKCREYMKPCITATQMLESMILNNIPTRAEVSDIANAIIDGTDCVMLSGETSVGNFPVEAVKIMTKIIIKTESEFKHISSTSFNNITLTPMQSICNAAELISNQLDVRAIIIDTKTGYTARNISSRRVKQAIFAISRKPSMLNYLKLLWGVVPLLWNKNEESIVKNIKFFKFIKKGDYFIKIYRTKKTEVDNSNAIEIRKF